MGIKTAIYVSPSSPKKSNNENGNNRRIWRWNQSHLAIYLLLLCFLLTFGIGSFLFFFISLNIPDITSLSGYRPPETTFFYDDSGKVIDRIYEQNRTVVALSKMNDLLPKAFIAAEDSRFYYHPGVDFWSILRAVLHNIKEGERGQGGSTITQQVARSLLLSPEKTYTRKLKEAIIAYRIDTVLSKEEVLELYLNQIYLGAGAYGVEAAAQTYFNKSVGDLNLAEIALLAGLPQAPSRYSPFRHFKQAKNRQAYVLNRMAEEGFITPTAARKAYVTPLIWSPDERDNPVDNYFIQHVKKIILQKFGREALVSGGLRIYTTMNAPLQEAADRSVKKALAKWAVHNTEMRLTGNAPQAALVAIEVATGEVKAMVGGTDYEVSQFNRAVQARRQPGSAFKPIIYAAAFERGYTPSTIIVDEPIRLRGSAPGQAWEPKNFDGKFKGPTSLRSALIHSRNIVTIRLLEMTGVSRVITLARNLGIHSPLNKNLSLALGSSGVSLLEMTGAYTVFANNGLYQQPAVIRKVSTRAGNVLAENILDAKQALSPESAYKITNILEGVIREGTGKQAQGLESPAAGKTGTTDRNMDAWFIGYTPRLAAGVWIGHDRELTLGETATGGRTAAPVWLDFMSRAERYFTAGTFVVPVGVELDQEPLIEDEEDSPPLPEDVYRDDEDASDPTAETIMEETLNLPHP